MNTKNEAMGILTSWGAYVNLGKNKLWPYGQKGGIVAHENTHIKLDLEDGQAPFFARGFLGRYDDEKTTGNGMFSRVPNPVRTSHDVARLRKRLSREWPKNLGGYHLVTGQRRPGNHRQVLVFRWNQWGQRLAPYWGDLDSNWREHHLVVTVT